MRSFQFALIFLAYNGMSCAVSSTREGVYLYVSYFTEYSDSTKLPLPPIRLENKIWFKDSCVIYEVKMFVDSTFHLGSEGRRSVNYRTLKYTYLDLQTMKCQDYKNFNELAEPVCNYYLSDGEMVSWAFYRKNYRPKADSVINLTDTIIDGKILNRVKWVYTFPPYGPNDGFYYISYLDFKSEQNIFHLNYEIEVSRPGAKVVREDFKEFNGGYRSIREGKIKWGLDAREKEIFQKWAENAKNTKLPLLAYKHAVSECRKFIGSPIPIK